MYIYKLIKLSNTASDCRENDLPVRLSLASILTKEGALELRDGAWSSRGGTVDVLSIQMALKAGLAKQEVPESFSKLFARGQRVNPRLLRCGHPGGNGQWRPTYPPPGLAIARELGLAEGKDQVATGQDLKPAATLGQRQSLLLPDVAKRCPKCRARASGHFALLLE